MSNYPPNSESFELNVKRAHFQCVVWYATMDPHRPKLDPTYYGWEKNEKLKTLMSIGVPKDRKPAPDEVLKTIKCSCTSEKPCATNRCSCLSSKISCSIVCSCRGDSRRCCNDQTKADGEREDGDGNTTHLDEEEGCQ